MFLFIKVVQSKCVHVLFYSTGGLYK